MQYEIIVANYAKPVQRNIDSILQLVSREYDVSIDDIRSKRRFRQMVEARYMFIFLALQYTSMTLVQLGKYLGGRDHTTCIHGREFINGMVLAKHDNPVKQTYLRLCRSFY